MEVGEKKTEAVTVKMPESTLRFLDKRARQKGMESAPEYIRHLIDMDKGQAEHDLSLLADSLGVQVSVGNMGFENLFGGDKS